MSHFPHAIDYICLLLAKRIAIGGDFDKSSWAEVILGNLDRQIAFGHHHEVCWLVWLAIIGKIDLGKNLIERIANQGNPHVISMLIQAFVDGKMTRRPRISFQNRLSSTETSWLTNIVARSNLYTKAPFGGSLKDECEHLAVHGLRLIDFDAHLNLVSDPRSRAISSNRFGYEDDDEDEHGISEYEDDLFGDGVIF